MNAGELWVEVRAKTQKYYQGLKGIETKTKASSKRMQASVSKIGSAFKMVFAGIGIYAIYRGIKKITQLAMVQEQAEADLFAALEATGAAAGDNIKIFRQYAAELQKTTIYGDEAILTEMAYGKNLGITTDKLKDATKAAIGLAARYRLDLRTSMMLLGRAALGQTQMLTRYGIVLTEGLSSQEKFNELLVLGAGYFGLAEAAAKTTAGQLAQFKNLLGDVGERLGELITPALIKRLEKFNKLLTGILIPDVTMELTLSTNNLKEYRKELDKVIRKLMVLHRKEQEGEWYPKKIKVERERMLYLQRVISYLEQVRKKQIEVGEAGRGSMEALKRSSMVLFNAIDKAVTGPLMKFKEIFDRLRMPPQPEKEGKKAPGGTWMGIGEIWRGAVSAALKGKGAPDARTAENTTRIEKHTKKAAEVLTEMSGKMSAQAGLVFSE